MWIFVLLPRRFKYPSEEKHFHRLKFFNFFKIKQFWWWGGNTGGVDCRAHRTECKFEADWFRAMRTAEQLRLAGPWTRERARDTCVYIYEIEGTTRAEGRRTDGSVILLHYYYTLRALSPSRNIPKLFSSSSSDKTVHCPMTSTRHANIFLFAPLILSWHFGAFSFADILPPPTKRSIVKEFSSTFRFSLIKTAFSIRLDGVLFTDGQ